MGGKVPSGSRGQELSSRVELYFVVPLQMVTVVTHNTGTRA